MPVLENLPLTPTHWIPHLLFPIAKQDKKFKDDDFLNLDDNHNRYFLKSNNRFTNPFVLKPINHYILSTPSYSSYSKKSTKICQINEELERSPWFYKFAKTSATHNNYENRRYENLWENKGGRARRWLFRETNIIINFVRMLIRTATRRRDSPTVPTPLCSSSRASSTSRRTIDKPYWRVPWCPEWNGARTAWRRRRRRRRARRQRLRSDRSILNVRRESSLGLSFVYRVLA